MRASAGMRRRDRLTDETASSGHETSNPSCVPAGFTNPSMEATPRDARPMRRSIRRSNRRRRGPYMHRPDVGPESVGVSLDAPHTTS